jgi:hypothetical protein
MAEVGNRRRIRIFRWIACGVATLVALLHLVHLGSDILFGPGGLSFRNVTAVQVALAALMTLYCVSLLLCWKWLKISGWLSLAAIGAFIGIVLPNGIISAWTVWWVGLLTVTMLSLPSLLLIAAAWFSRAPKTAAPAG